jgi:prophage regulatory protein
MNTIQPCRLLALPEVIARYGKRKAATYVDVREGIFPRPVVMSSRCARWPEADVEAIVTLRAAGGTDEDAERLVQRLASDRVARLEAHRQSMSAEVAH